MDASTQTRVGSRQCSYRWAVLGLVFSAFLITFLDRLAWTNAATAASKTLGVSVSKLGVLISAFYGGYVVANLLGGILTDCIGPRRTLACTLFPLAVATFFFGFSKTFLTGFLIQAIMGLCAGADYAACVKIVASWFAPKERGRAMGLLATAPSAGIVLSNAVFPLALRWSTWQSLYWTLGLFTALVAVACLVGVEDSPAAVLPGIVARYPVSAMLQNRRLRLIALVGFGANWGTWGFAFWASALMIRGNQLGATDAGVVTVIFGIAAILSKPLYGYLSDIRSHARRGLVIADLLAFAAMLVIFGSLHEKAQFLIAAPFLGISAFVYSPLLATMITEVTDEAMLGAAAGATNAFWQLGSVIVPSVVGVVFGASHSFQSAFITLAAGPLLAALCLLLDVGSIQKRENKR